MSDSRPPRKASDLLPLHLSVAGRRVLVAGGGPVAARKVHSLLAAGAAVTVVAPHACEDLVDAAAVGEIDWQRRDFAVGDVDTVWLAFAATGDAEVDSAVESAAEVKRVFCVRADSARHPGGSRTPAVLRRDDLTVSVATSDGADPRRSRALRDAIGVALDAGQLPQRRQRPGAGEVVLVGGGPGDVDLLTLGGRRALARADVVVADRLGPRDVLDELGPGVLVLDVGKAPGRHPVPQHAINQLLVDHASAGRVVVRLKGGDPFVFGRGAEEVAACREAGVPVTVIPGVTSAFAAPLAAGIPVTHREIARQVTVLAGHDADGVAAADWPALAAAGNAGNTLVVLMGVGALDHVAGSLLAAGMELSTPAAIVENCCMPTQRVTTGELAQIPHIAHTRGVQAPAVIVIGAVASFGVPN